MSADSCIHSIEMTGSPKIVIIGAGIAGIAAGNYLANAGFTDFVILEATDRVGGRIWSIDLGRFKQRARAVVGSISIAIGNCSLCVSVLSCLYIIGCLIYYTNCTKY